MKEKKSEATAPSMANAVQRAWLERAKADDAQRALLEKLESLLVEHSKALKNSELRCARLDSGLQRLLQNGHRCLMTGVDALAAQVIAGRSLSAIILEEQAQPQLREFYKRINLAPEAGHGVLGSPDHLTILMEFDAELGCVMILRAAILSQRKITAAATTMAMEKFSRITASARATIARELLVALAEIRRIAEPDQALATGLLPDEIEALRPKPLPLRILSSDLISWLSDAVAAGMIAAEELGSLKEFEAVAPAPPEPAVEIDAFWATQV